MIYNSIEDYPLIKQLRHYGLDHLVPQYAVSDDDESEGIGHTHRDWDEGELDPAEDEYYDTYDYDDDALNNFFEEEAQERMSRSEYCSTTLGNMDDFIRLFDDDSVDPEQLLSKNLWDLFGMTKKQMDMVPWLEVVESFDVFYDTFRNETRDLPIEKKIKYSVAQAVTRYRQSQIDFRTRMTISEMLGKHMEPRDMIEYLERMIDTYSFNGFRQFLPIYIDYLFFLPDGVEMNRRREANNEPTFKYEVFPKASHLQDLHDKAYRDYEVMNTERESKNKRMLNKCIKEVVNSTEYKNFLYECKDYVVLPVKNQQDLEREGKMLEHCVASYGSKLADGSSFIYFIRKADEPNKPFFTAEIVPSPSYEKVKPKLTQCYTYKDTITKSDSLKAFIQDWAERRNFKIMCRL